MTQKLISNGIIFDDAVLPVSVAGNNGPSVIQNDILLGGTGVPGALIRSLQDNVPTFASPGSGVSAQSVIAGSTNLSGQVQATLTAVAPGVVVGIVSFDDGPLPTAPLAVIVTLSAPTAGVAAPPTVGADTYGTSGFTIRSYGPTTVTTGTYIFTYFCIFK